MKKRILSLSLILCMMFTLSSVALAEGEVDYSPTTAESEVIPIFGHVGPDATIIDPEPATEIYVEVPIRIVFAAFESDAGVVSSPKYTITNLSEISELKVDIDNFRQKNSGSVPLNENLALKLVTYEGDDLLTDLFPSTYPPSKLLKERLSKVTDGPDDNKIHFMIGGFWSGTFEDEIKPIFDMTLKFSVAQ